MLSGLATSFTAEAYGLTLPAAVFAAKDVSTCTKPSDSSTEVEWVSLLEPIAVDGDAFENYKVAILGNAQQTLTSTMWTIEQPLHDYRGEAFSAGNWVMCFECGKDQFGESQFCKLGDFVVSGPSHVSVYESSVGNKYGKMQEQFTISVSGFVLSENQDRVLIIDHLQSCDEISQDTVVWDMPDFSGKNSDTGDHFYTTSINNPGKYMVCWCKKVTPFTDCVQNSQYRTGVSGVFEVAAPKGVYDMSTEGMINLKLILIA